MKLIYSILAMCFSLAATAQSLDKSNTAFISTEEAKQDINELIKTFEEVHYNPYFTVSKDQFNATKNRLMKGWDKDSISFRKFMATGMQLTALLSGGHSYMYWENPKTLPGIKAHQYIPFTGKLINNYTDFVVTRSKSKVIEPDKQITAINGIPIVDLYKECMSYLGGISAFKNAWCEELFPLFLFFNEQLKAPYTIKFSGTQQTVQAESLDLNELGAFINDHQVQENYTFRILENNIGLISYNSCTGYNPFNRFLEKTFNEIKKKNIDKLIIDISRNGGGDSGLNDLLLAYLTKKPYRQASGRYWKVSEQAKTSYQSNSAYERLFGKEFMDRYYKAENQSVIESLDEPLTQPVAPKNYFNGKTCFLIGPNTFSSANFLADAVKTYNISTLIGSSTGEYTNDFGEQLSFNLTNSQALVFISSTYDIGANGDHTTLKPVHPDLEVKADVLNFAIEWIMKNSNSSN